MQLSDFDYHLPEALIAQTPLADRSASRLLVVDSAPSGARFRHHQFMDLLEQLSPNDLLVVNDTQVLKARLQARKDSGGAAEVLLERILGEHEALCQVRVSKALQPGRVLVVESASETSSEPTDRLEMLERAGEFYRLKFSRPVRDVLDTHGSMPLPPYIDPAAARENNAEPHEQRYQTVYAREPGAVAAPTAGLHFTDSLLAALRTKGITVAPVTLHVGAGTFQPVRAEAVEEHRMHSEQYHISAATRDALEACTGRVVAVGTTVVRALESAAASGADSGDTDIFITPGFEFRAVDALITNFHLPKSTLLMLVAAFMGYQPMRAAYAEAVAERYRFFSYGDAMFIPVRADARAMTTKDV